MNFTITNDTSTPTLPGAGTRANPFLLEPIDQQVYVLASTQDVFVRLPVETGARGKRIVLSLDPTSRQTLYIMRSIGDTIGTRDCDYKISPPGGRLELEGV